MFGSTGFKCEELIHDTAVETQDFASLRGMESANEFTATFHIIRLTSRVPEALEGTNCSSKHVVSRTSTTFKGQGKKCFAPTY